MSRTLTAEMQAVADAKVVHPIYLVDLMFDDAANGDSRALHIWSGMGNITAPIGVDKVLNGGFTGSLASWTVFEIGTGTVTYSNNAVVMTAANFQNRCGVRQTIATQAGEKYTIQWTASGENQSYLAVRDLVGNVNIISPTGYELGTNQVTFTATSSSTRIDIRKQNAGTITVDNVSMRLAYEYFGAGDLIDISEINEASDLTANGASIVLSGIKQSLLTLARDEPYQGRAVKVYFAALDDNGNLISSPVVMFSGFMDVMTITDAGETSSISVTIENKLIAFDKAKVRRYTNEDHKITYPDVNGVSQDKGFEFVSKIQELDIYWGRATPAAAVQSRGTQVSTGHHSGGDR